MMNTIGRDVTSLEVKGQIHIREKDAEMTVDVKIGLKGTIYFKLYTHLYDKWNSCSVYNDIIDL